MKDIKKKYALNIILIILVSVIFLFFNSNKTKIIYNEKTFGAQVNLNNINNDNKKHDVINQDDLEKALIEYKLFNNINCHPSIKSNEGLGIILENNKIFFSKNIDKQKSIASITKLMTAIVAYENLDNSIITISARAETAFGDYGGFKTREKYTYSDLIAGMLLSSSNDAAVALAEKVGYTQFVKLMNQKAKEIGMINTFFADPSGLYFNNLSNAEDLTKLVKYILNNYPEIFELTRNFKLTIQELTSHKEKIIFNENKLAKENNFLGGKTGFFLNTNKGGMISLFRYHDYTVLIIVLDGGWEERYQDTKNILSCLPN